MLFKKFSMPKYAIFLFALVLVLISGLATGCHTLPTKGSAQNNAFVVYIKPDGLYLTYLDDNKNIKVHDGTEFRDPVISKSGSYIAYTHGDSLFIFNIEKGKYEEIAKEVTSYDWIDDENIVYSTNETGFTKFNMANREKTNHIDEYHYSNFKASKDGFAYGKQIFEWTTEEGDFATNKGIVEINLNEYNSTDKKFAVNIIIEGKKSTDDMIGYDPTISSVSNDGKYIYIIEKSSSGSLSADAAGIGLYDVEDKTHVDFTDIYGNESEDLIVLPYENNIAINPRNNDMISVIRGSGREMLSNKEIVLLNINENKTYEMVNFMDKDMTAMTPSFTDDGTKILFSATKAVDPSKENDYMKAVEKWENQPHNIYEYDLKTAKINKITNEDCFYFMPISLSDDAILFIRRKDNSYNLVKIMDGKEKIIADDIVLDSDYISSAFYGHIKTEKALAIFK